MKFNSYIIRLILVIVALSWAAKASGADLQGGTMTGSLKLNDNTYLLNPIKVSGTLTIDLNGYVLCPKGGAKCVIEVPGGATLIIKDSNPNLGHQGYIDENGIFRWPFVTGKTPKNVGGGIIYNPYTDAVTGRKGIEVSGTCTVENGKIMGCYTPGIGAAVTVSSSGTFKMTGGEISYNYSKKYDSGVSGIIYGESTNNNDGSRINLSHVNINHNRTEGRGGVICGYHVTLTDCNIQHNSAAMEGGAIYVRSGVVLGTLNINGCTISNNTAELGGAIYTNNGTPCTIENSTISHNTATSSGGGINASGPLSISGSTISYNSGVNGGGIRVSGNCTIYDTTIEHNYATTNGGGIYSSAPTEMRNSRILNNRAMATETGINASGGGVVNQGRGGGFCFTGNNDITKESDAVTFVLDNTEVTGNACMYYGGGGHLQNKGKLIIQNGTKINKNTSVLKGAAGLHLTGGVYFYMKETCEISENIALGGVGGGIHSSYECFIHLDGGTISNNIAYGRGGGVHVNTGGDLVLNGTNITGNKAYDGINMISSTVTKGTDGKYTWSDPVGISSEIVPGYGGGLLINSGSCTMNKGSLSGNHAQTLGGGIGLIMTESGNYAHHVRLATFTLNAGSVSDNTSDGNGAGVYLMENVLQYLSETEKSKYTQLVASGDWTPKIVLNGGTISGNVAQNNGGGAYQEQKTEFVVPAGKNAILSGNQAKKSGGAVYIASGSFSVNGRATITGNKATELDGGAVYLGEGTNSSPSQFIVGNNGVIYLGGDTGSEGNVAGSNGGGIYCMGSFTVNGTASMKNNNAVNGGAVYVNGGNVILTRNTISSNRAVNGGAMYIIGGGNLNLTGETTMQQNVASGNGGVAYVEGGNITASGTPLTLSANNAVNGGAFYVSGGSINTTNSSGSSGNITDNFATAEGGAFYVNNGNIVLGKTNMSNNGKSGSVPKTVNGGAIALYNGTFSIGEGSEIKNNAATGNGGGLYVMNNTQTQNTITCTGGSFVGNTAKLGGGIYAYGEIKLTFAANIRDNVANNGGGIYMANGVSMSFGDGLIVANKANKETGNSTTTGIGGGIYVAGGTLEFTSAANLGIYNNAAEYEAADIYSSGNSTTINLPYVKDMNLTGFDVPGSELYWVQDYHEIIIEGETYGRYEYELKNMNTNIEAMILGFTPAEVAAKNKVVTTKTCLDLGYDLVWLKLYPIGITELDNAEVSLLYKKAGSGEEVEYRKVVFAGPKVKVVGLPSGDWKFVPTEWNYRYDVPKIYKHETNTEISGYTTIDRNEITDVDVKYIMLNNMKDIVSFGNRVVNKMKIGGGGTSSNPTVVK